MSERWDEMDDVDLLHLEAEMQDDLNNLRTAATVYADRAWKRNTMLVPSRSASHAGLHRRWLGWAAAGVTAAALAVGGVRMIQQDAPQDEEAASPAVRVPAASPVSDEALLDQIQSDLSTGVPAAMEPLQTSGLHEVHEVVRQ